MAGKRAGFRVGFWLAIIGWDKGIVTDRIALATTGYTPFPF
jgi:hypothetical protein